MIARSLLPLLAAATVSSATPAGAETLDALVAREEASDAYACTLKPKPRLEGAETYIVVVPWFEDPGVWATRSLLLVGVDRDRTVVAQRELKLAHRVFPRSVTGVACDGRTLRIDSHELDRRPDGDVGVSTRHSYRWNGRTLRSTGVSVVREP